MADCNIRAVEAAEKKSKEAGHKILVAMHVLSSEGSSLLLHHKGIDNFFDWGGGGGGGGLN